MNFCFWCNQEATFKLKNGKFCCCNSPNSCIGFRKKNSLSHKGNVHSKETRLKISSSNKNQPASEKTKQNIKNAMKKKKDNGWINHPPETRKKMSEKRKRWKPSEDEIKRRVETRKGYKHSEQTKEKMRKPHHSEEFKEAQRQRMLNGGSIRLHKSIKKISKQELNLRNIVKEIYSDCEFQFGVLNYFLDVAILKYKIAIEFDGWYHFDTEEHKQYHKFRQERIEKEGWKFYRVTIFDKFPNKDQVKESIEKLI